MIVDNPEYLDNHIAKMIESRRNRLAQKLTRIEELFRVHVKNYDVQVFLVDNSYISAKITEIGTRGHRQHRITHVIPVTNDNAKTPIYIPDYLEKEINGLRELIESYNLG